MFIVKHVQSSSFRKEISMLNQGSNVLKGPLASLTPFLDKNGVRVGGRLENSEFKYDKKYPVLLPGGHTFTKRLFPKSIFFGYTRALNYF